MTNLEYKQLIQQSLQEVERLDDVKVLYACESGSRAWGFESSDSDWDVRFIYVRLEDRYLSLTGQDSTIDRNTGLNMETKQYIRDICDKHDIDLAGWDLEKALHQLGRGNPVLAEWFCSPIVYMKREPYSSMIRNQIKWFYKNKAGIYHYEHMARRNFNKYILVEGDDVIVKKYLYILRPLFAMAWLDTRESPPPMEFHLLYDDPEIMTELESQSKKGVELAEFARELVEKKKAGTELGVGPRNDLMDRVILFFLDFFKAKAERMKVLERKELSTLDPLFYHIVTEMNADWEDVAMIPSSSLSSRTSASRADSPGPVFDKPQRFSDFTKKLSETGEDGATHVLKKDWVFSPDLCPEIYRKGTRVVVGKRRIMFLGSQRFEGCL